MRTATHGYPVAVIHQIVDLIDGNGHPVIVYAAFPATSDHRYRYARWTGSTWDDNEIAAAGGSLYPEELYYSGGVCLDPADTGGYYHTDAAKTAAVMRPSAIFNQIIG